MKPSKHNSSLLSVLTLGAGLLGTAVGVWSVDSYMDLPGTDDGKTYGKTVNDICLITAGIAAQKISGNNATIDVAVQKTLYPDVGIKGHVTGNHIFAYMPLQFKTNIFSAQLSDNHLSGSLKKSGTYWTVNDEGKDTYRIGRFGLAYDGNLTLHIADGKITGNYELPFFMTWPINGSYKQNGDVHVEISVPWLPDATLDGKLR